MGERERQKHLYIIYGSAWYQQDKQWYMQFECTNCILSSYWHFTSISDQLGSSLSSPSFCSTPSKHPSKLLIETFIQIALECLIGLVELHKLCYSRVVVIKLSLVQLPSSIHWSIYSPPVRGLPVYSPHFHIYTDWITWPVCVCYYSPPHRGYLSIAASTFFFTLLQI